MPIRQLLIPVLLIAAFLGSPAHAEQAYFGGNFALLKYDTESLDSAIGTRSLYGRVGLGDKRGIFRGEMRLGFIKGKEDLRVVFRNGRSDATLEASGTLIGAYFLVGIPVELSTVRPYAFLGYSLTGWTEKLCYGTVSQACEEVDDDINDLSFGFGVDFDVGGNWIVNVEYGSYVDASGAYESSHPFFGGEDIDVQGLSVGVSLSFGS